MIDLTQEQYDELSEFYEDGDRYGYYLKLAEWGDNYARIASQIVSVETIAGASATIFMMDWDETPFASLTDQERDNFIADLSLRLMEADYQARSDLSAIGWRVIQSYHHAVYDFLKIGRDAWVPNILLDALANDTERDDAWARMMNPANPLPIPWSDVIYGVCQDFLGDSVYDDYSIYAGYLVNSGIKSSAFPSNKYGGFDISLSNGGRLIGNDELDGVIVGTSADDVLMSFGGDDQVYGGHGNDRIYGGLGDDTLIGGEGGNIIDGGKGQDILVSRIVGNPGSDNDWITPSLQQIQSDLGGDLTLFDLQEGNALNDEAGHDYYYTLSPIIHTGSEWETPYVSLSSNMNSSDPEFLPFDIIDDKDGRGGVYYSYLDHEMDYYYSIDLYGMIDHYEFGNVTFTYNPLKDIHEAKSFYVKLIEDGGVVVRKPDDVLPPDGQEHVMFIVKELGVDPGSSRYSSQLGLRLESLMNQINGTIGANSLLGTAKDDRIDGGAGDDTITAGSGNDVVYGGDGNDAVYGGDGYDDLRGGSGNDSLYGQDGEDDLTGDGGNDTLNGGAGADRLAGGTGDDIYYVDNAADRVTELSGQGSDRVFASANYTLAAGVHVEWLATTLQAGTDAVDLTGNELAQTVNGNNGANVLNGGGGDDTITGQGGSDTLYGGDGNDLLNGGIDADTMAGEAGDDIYYLDNAGDTITELSGEGYDRAFASVNYTLASGAHVESLATTLQSGTTAINLTGNELAQTVNGNDGSNSLNGGGGNDTITGRGGNDILNGGTGVDAMAGGTGDDTYYIDNAGDTVSELSGEGYDRVFASVDYTLASGVHVEWLATTLQAGTGAIDLTGNALAQTVNGNNGANVLNGGGGDDTITGQGGSDTLSGGTGNDTLTGGAGADTFVFDVALTAANRDTITDFNVADDTIRLAQSVFTTLSTGALAASAFAANASGAATTAAHRIVYETDTGFLSYDSDGTGGNAAVHFATLGSSLAVTANDFFVV